MLKFALNLLIKTFYPPFSKILKAILKVYISLILISKYINKNFIKFKVKRFIFYNIKNTFNNII